jgi:hypothetical protein
MATQEPDAPVSSDEYERYDLSKISAKDRAWLYLKSMYGIYEDCEDADLLRFELRCRPPKWTGSTIKMANLRYLPILGNRGYDAAVDYIWQYRDKWDIFNGILVRRDITGLGFGGELMRPEACPYVGLWAIDIDGKGIYGPMEGKTPIQSAILHLKKAVEEKRVPDAHMLVEGKNGIHAYWMHLKATNIEGPDGSDIYRNNLKRLAHWISGDPDEVDQYGKPDYSGPHVDTNPTFKSATLRPVGSYNHKERGNPKVVRLIRHDFTRSPLYNRRKWTVELLPPLPEPAAPDPELRDAGRMDAFIGPWQRRKLTYRTSNFISQGCPPGEGFHRMMMQGVSDLNHCNYTAEEAFGMLVLACSGEKQIEELRDFIWPQNGNRIRYQERGGWNQTVVNPDDVLDKDESIESILQWVLERRKSLY